MKNPNSFDDRFAKAIVETLNRAGFVAYYAGGWVRDFILHLPSDDVDIATNAPPETIQALFPHTVPLGIAFGIVLVIYEGHPFEVATFRKDLDYRDGRRPSRVEFSTPEEDAKRRDFTINGLFYDPIRNEVLDFVEGRTDIIARVIRAIGDPHQRIKEDRLRMVRAIRLACRLNFSIEKNTQEAIRARANELMPAVAIERIVQELTKIHAYHALPKMLLMLHEYHLLTAIFPELHSVSLQDLEERIEPITRYPTSAPLLLYLLPLFPSYTLEQQLFLSKELKCSNIDQQWIQYLSQAKKIIYDDERGVRPIENVEWVHFYAHSFCQAILQILAAHRSPDEAQTFLNAHSQRMATLRQAIENVQSRTPVIRAENLLRIGIPPGVEMGTLLKEAERISCNEQIFSPALVIEKLRHTPFWPRH